MSMMSRYHRGSATTLNVFVTKFKNTSTIGYTMNFPVELAVEYPKYDGIILDYRTLFGLPKNVVHGVFKYYSQGKNLVHEIGKSDTAILVTVTHHLIHR
jgi:hypothetical protein